MTMDRMTMDHKPMDRCQTALRQFLSAAAIAAMVLCTAAFPAHADDVGITQSELIQRLLPTVVNIAVHKVEAAGPPDPAPGVQASMPGATTPATDTTPTIKGYVGSGFIIDASGLIVTNYHVVEDAFEIAVTFSDGSRLPGKMLSASRLADLALVKVEADHPLTPAHWGNSDKLQVGDQVFAAGDPFGIGLSVSAGIVSGLNRDIQNSPYDDLIQTDATINHGNSGGPLFDMQGNVIGVNSTIISPTQGSAGIGFAIPSSSASFVIDRLRTYGWVRPGWIGVKVQTVTPDIADAMGMSRPQGSIVAWVLPDGPAKKAGLAIGDVILRYNSNTPSDERALLRDIAHTAAGDKVTLVVRRDGKETDIDVTPEAWPRNQWDAKDAPMPVQQPKINVPPGLGLSLAPLAEADRAKLGLENGLNGVLVTKVAPNSDSASRGLATGDIILRVQDKPVVTPDEVQAEVHAARASKRAFVLVLVLPKTTTVPGPKWVALQLGPPDGG
jgi:serine protease Do